MNIALIKLAICANKWPLAAIVRKNEADAHQTAIIVQKASLSTLKGIKRTPLFPFIFSSSLSVS